MRKPRKFVTVVALLAVGAGALGACGSSDAGDPVSDDTLTLAILTPMNSYDPTKMDCGSGRLYCQAAYDSLLHRDPDQQPIPGMAETFEYDATRTKLTLKLRAGIVFGDGTPFDSSAAKANLEHFTEASGSSAAMAASIKGVTAAGSDGLVIELTAPDPALLVNLSLNLGMMVSPKALGSEALASTPAGAGPYVLDGSRSQTGKAVFARNEKYWDKSAYPFDTVELVMLNDPNTIINALKVGQIDVGPLTSSQFKNAERNGLEVTAVPNGWAGLIIADRAGKVLPALGELDVRRAINMAVDRKLFSEALGGGTNPKQTTQIFSPGSVVYDEALDKRYERDIPAAKKLMADAGYGDGFAVSMPDLSAFIGSPALNSAIEQQLGNIGIDVTWEKVPVVQLLGSMQEGDFPMFFMQLGSRSPWQDLQLSVLPSASFNPFQSTAPELAELLKAAQHATPGAEQDAGFRAVNEWLVDNAWFAPITVQEQGFAVKGGIKIERQSQGVDLVRYQPAGS